MRGMLPPLVAALQAPRAHPRPHSGRGRRTSILQMRERGPVQELGPGPWSLYLEYYAFFFFFNRKYYSTPGRHRVPALVKMGWIPADLPFLSQALCSKVLSASGCGSPFKNLPNTPPAGHGPIPTPEGIPSLRAGKACLSSLALQPPRHLAPGTSHNP